MIARSLFVLLLLGGCGLAGGESRTNWAELIARNPASGEILLFGSGAKGEPFLARVAGDAVVGRTAIPAQHYGALAGVWIGPDGTIRLANEVGESFEIIESRDGREWSYPTMYRGTFGSFFDGGGFTYLAGSSSRDQPLHRVDSEGEDREIALPGPAQTPAACGRIVLSSDGYEMQRIELRDEGAVVTDRWTIEGRSAAFLVGEDEIVVAGLEAVVRLRAGVAEPEVLRRHRDRTYGALTTLAVDEEGNVVFIHKDEGSFEFFGSDGARLRLPLPDDLWGPRGGGSLYRCRSNEILRDGDRLYLAQGTLAIVGITDGIVRIVEVE